MVYYFSSALMSMRASSAPCAEHAMITAILDRVAGLPGPLRHVCERLFSIDVVKGYTVPPAAMEGWVARQFGAVADVREQTIVKIVNRLTLEGALFNPLRARRPGESRTSDA